MTELARLTIQAPHRQVDVALPDQTPLAELLPGLLRQAGEDLADQGQEHGGWVLCRTDGGQLSIDAGLAQQSVYDGDVLHLVPAATDWPEWEYDDVVDAIAASARARGRRWDPAATRATTLALASVALLLGLAGVVRAGTGTVGLAVAAVLLGVAVLSSRAYGDATVAATLAGAALPYAAAGGYLLERAGGPPGAGHPVLAGTTGLLLAAVIGAIGVWHALRVFTAGMMVGVLGTLGALCHLWVSAPSAAAMVLATAVLGMPALPPLAVRVGRLPVPALTPIPVPAPPPAAAHLPDRRGLVDQAGVHAAVLRADEVLTGLLLGTALCVLCCGLLLVGPDAPAGRALVGVAGLALALRSRIFPAVRHRLPLLFGGAGTMAVLAAWMLNGVAATGPVASGPEAPGPAAWGPATLGIVALSVVALGIVAGGMAYRHRAPGPYLGRLADLLDVLCVLSVVPVICAVLGLYARARGVVG